MGRKYPESKLQDPGGYGWSRDKAVRQLVLVGLFISFIFATGMGEYLLRITDAFITQFAIILGVLLELIVLGWVYDIEEIRSVLNENSYIKVDKSWIITIKVIIPIILGIIWILGVYNLILAGDRQSLLVQSIIASIFVIVPLALTVIPNNVDYSLDVSREGKNGVNYFKEKEYVDKTIDDYGDSEHGALFDENGSFVNPYRSLRNRFKKSDDEDTQSPDESELDDMEEDNNSKSRRLNRFVKSKSRSGKNVLRNVDLSSEEFDSPYDEDFDEKYNKDDVSYSDVDEKKSDNAKRKSKSLFDKISMFNRDKDEDLSDEPDDDLSFDDDFGEGDYISPIKDSKSNSQNRTDRSRNHTFKSSKDADVFDNLDDYVEKPKSKAKSTRKSESKKPKVEEPVEEEEYEDFSDDFFDDGVFGDEGYESLLDDYVEKPKKSKKSSKPKKESSSNKSKQLDDEDIYYDYEGKGADSVFNLDD